MIPDGDGGTAGTGRQDSGETESQVVFRRFAMGADRFPDYAEFSNFRGDKRHTEPLEKGFVYIFYRDRNGRTKKHDVYEIQGANESLIVQHIIPETTATYYAYSQIRLSEERINDLNDDAVYGNSGGRDRAVMINSRLLLGQENNNSPNFEVSARDTPFLDVEKKEIYLYDWFGYLQDYAQKISGTDFTEYDTYLNEDVNPAGVLKGQDGQPIPSTGLKRRELYAYTAAVLEFVGDKNELKEVLQHAKMKTFTEDTEKTLKEFRDGARLGTLIRLVCLLLKDDRANQTFIDYMYGERGDQWELIGNIAKCLYRWDEILEKEDVQKLLAVWSGIAVRFKEDESSAGDFFNNGQAKTAGDVRRFFRNPSVFLYIIATASADSDDEFSMICSILGVWVSANIPPDDLLTIHGLVVTGVMKNYVSPVASVSLRPQFENGGTQPVPVQITYLPSILNVVTEGSTVKILKVVHRISAYTDNIITVYNFFVDSAMAVQVAREYDLSTASPYILSSAESLVSIGVTIKNLIKTAPAEGGVGVAVLPFIFAVNMWIKAGRMSGRRGDEGIVIALTTAGTLTFFGGWLMLGTGAGLFSPAGILIVVAIGLQAWAGPRIGNKVRLALQHTIWGKENGETPSPDELESWWPLVKDEDSIANENGNIKEEYNRIFFSNFKNENDTTPYMRLNMIGSINSDPFPETFKRNEFMLALLTQIPALEALEVRVSIDSTIGVGNYCSVNIQGLQNIPFVESVSIKIMGKTPETTMYENTFIMDPENGSESALLPLLRVGSRRITDRNDVADADFVGCVFLADRADVSNARLHFPEAELILLPSAEIFRDYVDNRVLDATVKYHSASNLLPVHIKYEFG